MSPTVRKALTDKGWLVQSYAGNTGFVTADQKVVGVTSMEGNLGDIGPMNVSAFWGFDRDGRLVDVWVWRTFDVP